MPGFRHCSWCQGKGCMCCDAEQAKHEKREADLKAEADRRRLARLNSPEFKTYAVARIKPDDSVNPLRTGPSRGFRYCDGCAGNGCEGCQESEDRFLTNAVRNAMWWRQDNPDVRDLRDAVIREEARRRADGFEAWTEGQVEELFKPALDAEYARQFPDGPRPIFSARLDSPEDMRLLKAVAGRESVEAAFSPGGGGVAEIEKMAEAARGIQAGRVIVD